MKTESKKQFVIYSRKSKFTGKGESIENQIEMCRQYIIYHYLYARLGWSITKRKNANYIPQYAHLITKIALVRTNRYWTSAF